ncbi:type I restriction enzyme M protein [Actinokineospora alba]|uniref:Type I restriction enzyme M protein n=1 Tax=Actinokineospora alba TaxID=504798 RepID=A0A1H0VID0_9PSEU|nr:N-6 DNA methylase [Actinokineospora alba]TDP67694.1 type I restriction enzyme M protein [Actinokineospora alba]SDJ28184.1 type I restriction enzyme M protein [Actinokineospora alba]SDP78329.1 type I restriction enzyme M protein [Actinokineospora alba]
MQDQCLDLDIPQRPINEDEPAVSEEGPKVITVGEYEVVDYITGRPIKETPKEKVRQRVARALFHEHGIAPSDMERDYAVRVRNQDSRTSNKRADIAIFAHGAPHTEENLRRVVVCKPEPKRGKNVIKLREPAQAQKDLDELKALMGHDDRPGCVDGLWTDSVDFFFLKKKINTFGATYEFRSEWDVAPESLGSRTVASHQKLRRADPEMLKISFRRCHNYIHGNEGMPKDAAFWQFLYLLFAKMYDERVSRGTGRARFRTEMAEPFSEEEFTPLRERILALFEDVKTEYKSVFKSSDEITLSDRALSFIVSELGPYDLSATDVDAKGLAYQELVGTNLRGDRGQYFTPRGAVKLMVEILDPQEDENVLDPTCGTGGFLTETLNHFHHKWQKEEGTFGFPDTEEQQERFRDRLNEYADEHLFGADFDPFLVRATTMNIMTLANTTGNLFHMDSLAFPRGHLSGVDLARDRIPLGKVVDVLLTNPPFGADIPISDESVLGDFRDGVAKSWGRDKETGMIVVNPNAMPKSMAPEQLFIQRAIEWVKPGGRIGIVLPNGILSNPGPADEGVRRYILEQCWVLASIELPVETFIVDANVNILTTLLFLKRKTEQEIMNSRMGSEKPYPVFMAVAEKVGVDRRGNELYKREANGDIITETTVERERIEINGQDVVREFTRSRKVVDNDLPIIGQKYREFRDKYPIPGADPRDRRSPSARVVAKA